MAYKDKNKQREYVRQWMANRRKEWFINNGPCIKCGSYNNLCIHHQDPTTKISHKIWSWAKERREKELKKCVVLCEYCHIKLHTAEYAKYNKGPPNTGWCSKCRQFKLLDLMVKNKNRLTGYSNVCKECHRHYIQQLRLKSKK